MSFDITYMCTLYKHVIEQADECIECQVNYGY